MPVTQQLAADLAKVKEARILFSHHSVGRNVLAGVSRVESEVGGRPIRLVSIEEAGALDGALLAHGSGGRNGDPRSKIDFFAATLRGDRALRLQLAFMKLCYVDFDPATDVDALFEHYRRTLEALRREYPEIRFAHVTVPLHRRPSDVKSVLRRLAGREVWEDRANAKRAEFNRRLLEAFPDDPVFDLARLESTGPHGDVATFELDGRSYPSLHPALTDDGGHLNAVGERAAAVAAIRFMAGALPASAAR